jgi:K+-sensing histidine kinase KdpD
MEFRNKKRWRQNPLEGYLVGFIGFALAFVIRKELQGPLDDALPTFFFTVSTIIVAARYGLWPALFTIVLSLPTSLFFFVKPYDEFAIPTFRDMLTIVYFSSVTLLVSIVIEWSHRSKYNSELNARVSDSRYRLMVQMERDIQSRPVTTTPDAT